MGLPTLVALHHTLTQSHWHTSYHTWSHLRRPPSSEYPCQQPQEELAGYWWQFQFADSTPNGPQSANATEKGRFLIKFIFSWIDGGTHC